MRDKEFFFPLGHLKTTVRGAITSDLLLLLLPSPFYTLPAPRENRFTAAPKVPRKHIYKAATIVGRNAALWRSVDRYKDTRKCTL